LAASAIDVRRENNILGEGHPRLKGGVERVDQKEKLAAHLAVFVGTRRGIGMTTAVAHFSTIVGMRYQLKTLLLDLSPHGTSAMQILGLNSQRSVLDLVQPWLERGRIEAEDLEAVVLPWRAVLLNEGEAAKLDVLSGYRNLSEVYADRLRAYREWNSFDLSIKPRSKRATNWSWRRSGRCLSTPLLRNYSPQLSGLLSLAVEKRRA
jgi:hypothetical protein